MRNIPGIIPENSPEIIPQPDGSYDGRDVDRDTQPDADTSVEQFDPMPTNPRSSKYDLRHNAIIGSQITMTTTDINSVRQPYPEHLRIFSGSPKNV